MITLRPYQPPSFLTSGGASAKKSLLKRKGFPSVKNWVFCTVTLDRSQFADSLDGYIQGKERLRRFTAALREAGYTIRRWCWRMEFHQEDEQTGEIWPHWHFLIDYKGKFDLLTVNECWGLGRVNLKRVRSSNFEYVFKYVTKPMEHLPEWLLEMRRIRLFQSSPNFFPDSPASDDSKENVKASPRLSIESTDRPQNDETIRERLKRWSSSVVSRSILSSGAVRYELHTNLAGSWGELLIVAARTKHSRHLGEEEMSITYHKLESSELWIKRLPVSSSMEHLFAA